MHYKKTIAVVGDGIEALISTLYLKIALLRLKSSTDIVLIANFSEKPSGFSRVLSNIHPFNNDVFSALGDPDGMPCFRYFDGIFHHNWPKNGAFPTYISLKALNIPEFGEKMLQQWMKIKAGGYESDFSKLMLALANRGFENDSEVIDEIEDKNSGIAFDNADYMEYLLRAIRHFDITIYESGIKIVNLSDGYIASIALNDNRTVMADLFIDASEMSQTLVNRLQDVEREDWSDDFKFDRVISGYLFKNASASLNSWHCHEGGWISLSPIGENRIGFKLAASSKSSCIDVRESLSKLVTIESNENIEIVSDLTIRPGLIVNSWINNCLVVGSAACRLDSVSTMDLQPLLISLNILTEYLNYNPFDVDFRDSYGSKYCGFMNELRLFQSAHYPSNIIFDQKTVHSSTLSSVDSTLMERVNLFSSSGCFLRHEFEFFEEITWIQLFMGLGITPKQIDPTLSSGDEEAIKAKFNQIIQKYNIKNI